MWSPTSLDDSLHYPSPTRIKEEIRTTEKIRTSKSNLLEDRIKKTPFATFEDKVSDFKSWPAERQLEAIRTLKDTPVYDEVMEQACETYIDDPERVLQLVLFYANPKNPQGSLAIDREMRSVMKEYSILRFKIVPVTTVGEFKSVLKKLKPKVFCFTGHADERGLYFTKSFTENTPEFLSYTSFGDIIKECYSDRKSSIRLYPELILLFACKTIHFMNDILRRNDDFYSDIHIIGWKTLSEDNAARVFAESIFRSLMKTKTGNKEAVSKMFNDAVSEMVYKNKVIGDPETDLNNW
jgi:hypothetical protein